MDALVKYLKWFSEHPGISKDALSDILRLEHNEVLPSGNKLRSPFADSMKLAEPLFGLFSSMLVLMTAYCSGMSMLILSYVPCVEHHAIQNGIYLLDDSHILLSALG